MVQIAWAMRKRCSISTVSASSSYSIPESSWDIVQCNEKGLTTAEHTRRLEAVWSQQAPRVDSQPPAQIPGVHVEPAVLGHGSGSNHLDCPPRFCRFWCHRWAAVLQCHHQVPPLFQALLIMLVQSRRPRVLKNLTMVTSKPWVCHPVL